MASIADLLITGAQRSAETTNLGLKEGYQQGAALAMEQEKLEQSKSALKQKQTDNELAKLGMPLKVLEVMNDPNTDPTQADNLAKNYLPEMINALKIGHVYTPDFLEGIQKSRDARRALQGVLQQAEERILKGEDKQKVLDEYQARLTDPLERTILFNEGKQFQAASKFAKEEANKKERAYIEAQTSLNKQMQAQSVAGELEVEKEIGKAYAQYQVAGGKSGLRSAIGNLGEVLNTLETGTVKSGGVSTRLPWFKSDEFQTMANPQMVELRNQAQSALNNVLRTTLGAQFTEKEGERVLNQVWDDKATPAANAKKLRRKLTELRSDVMTRENEFIKRGYMKNSGSSGQWNGDSKAPIKDWKPRVKALKSRIDSIKAPAKREALLNELAKDADVSLDEIKKELGY